jgi:hypothetical protein
MIKFLQKGVRYSLRLMRHFAEEATLQASDRLPQPPPYFTYWYDPTIHALVGLLVGLDLHRHDGRYHVIETNLGPRLSREGRALYDTPLDPIISALVAVARSRGFARLVFFQPSDWSKPYLNEFQLASRQSGLEVLGLTAPSLPERLSANTIYVAAAGQRQPSPLCRFVHDKYWSAKWLKETIDAEADRIKLLTYVPTFDRLVLPKEQCKPGWPNLVIKLSDKDAGEAVVFGRFRSRKQARRALRSSPSVFAIKWRDRWFHRTIYQPFIEPEVIDNRPRNIRLHAFVSPLLDTFLSAYARVGRIELPKQVAEGLVEGNSPFLVSISAGGASYARVEPIVEEELRAVTEEFGRVANLAINRKFQTAPTIADASDGSRNPRRTRA